MISPNTKHSKIKYANIERARPDSHLLPWEGHGGNRILESVNDHDRAGSALMLGTVTSRNVAVAWEGLPWRERWQEA